MQIATDVLNDLLDSMGSDWDTVVREEYGWSGGQTCLGLVFDGDGQWEELLIELALYAEEIGAVGELKAAVHRARKDSMGRGIIVFWPYGGLTLAD